MQCRLQWPHIYFKWTNTDTYLSLDISPKQTCSTESVRWLCAEEELLHPCGTLLPCCSKWSQAEEREQINNIQRTASSSLQNWGRLYEEQCCCPYMEAACFGLCTHILFYTKLQTVAKTVKAQTKCKQSLCETEYNQLFMKLSRVNNKRDVTLSIRFTVAAQI